MMPPKSAITINFTMIVIMSLESINDTSRVVDYSPRVMPQVGVALYERN
jgi:hypothetical protein